MQRPPWVEPGYRLEPEFEPHVPTDYQPPRRAARRPTRGRLPIPQEEDMHQPGTEAHHPGTTPEQRAHWRALAEAATPGPWYIVGPPWAADAVGTYVVAGHHDPHVGTPVLDSIDIDEWDADAPGPDYSQSDADLTFAAAAREALPLLLAEVERLEAAIHQALTILDPPASGPANDRDGEAVTVLALGLGPDRSGSGGP